MPRVCTICSHPRRQEIDAALVACESYRTISKIFDVSAQAVGRHVRKHLVPRLAEAKQTREVADAQELLIKRLEGLLGKAVNILNKAEDANDLRTALLAVREARETLLAEGKVQRLVDQEPPPVNIVLLPQWVELRTVVLTALDDYPEARLAVAQALLHAGG